MRFVLLTRRDKHTGEATGWFFTDEVQDASSLEKLIPVIAELAAQDKNATWSSGSYSQKLHEYLKEHQA